MRKSNKGQALLFFVVVFTVAMGMLGLALDGSRLFAERQRAQNLADAAALGAAHELARDEDTPTERLAAAARNDALLNGFDEVDGAIRVTRLPDGPPRVEVIVEQPVKVTLLALFGPLSRPVRARAVAGVTAASSRAGTACIQVLAEDGPDALVVEGEGAVRVDCPIEVASADPAAVRLEGDGCLSADALATAAELEGACVSAERRERPERRAATTPAGPLCDELPPGHLEEGVDGRLYLWPGCYQKLEIGVRSAVFAPGVYLILEGMVAANAELEGEGVSFHIAGGPLQLDETVVARLSPPAAGAREGLLFSVAPEANEAVWLTPAPGSRLEGTLLAPTQELAWAPNDLDSGAWNQVTAWRLRLIARDDARTVQAPAAPRASGMELAGVLLE